MKQSKILRRERAKARFSVLSIQEWRNQKGRDADKALDSDGADYSAYLDRKREEGVALSLRVVPVLENGNYVDAHIFARTAEAKTLGIS